MIEVPKFVRATPREVAASLAPGTLHLWRIPHDPRHGRAPLLAVLAAYLEVPADAVTLTTTAKGKPLLARGPGAGNATATLEFNWSHSGALALIALSRSVALGVDIEHLGKQPRALDIARRFFDPGEARVLEALEGEARMHAFISLWCAKEAVLKAAGEGLSFGLARLAFRSDRGSDWRLAATDPALGELGAWQLAGFAAAPEYRGALAWRGVPQRIAAFHAKG